MAETVPQVLLGSGLTVLSQPLMYVKVLVQVRPQQPLQEVGEAGSTRPGLLRSKSHWVLWGLLPRKPPLRQSVCAALSLSTQE